MGHQQVGVLAVSATARARSIDFSASMTLFPVRIMVPAAAPSGESLAARAVGAKCRSATAPATIRFISWGMDCAEFGPETSLDVAEADAEIVTNDACNHNGCGIALRSTQSGAACQCRLQPSQQACAQPPERLIVGHHLGSAPGSMAKVVSACATTPDADLTPW
jgi:hypothetical protein